MDVRLDDEQVDMLRTLIEATLGNLSYEIASADLPSYRQVLRRRRDMLRTVFEAVTVPAPHA